MLEEKLHSAAALSALHAQSLLLEICRLACAWLSKVVLVSGRRRGGEDGEEENMDEWDQEKLEAVVKQKHGTEKNRPTDIICKFFLDAVEKKMYGW